MTYRNGKATQLRDTSGQFQRASLATFGLAEATCAKCGCLNLYDPRPLVRRDGFWIRENAPRPTKCENCGEELGVNHE